MRWRLSTLQPLRIKQKRQMLRNDGSEENKNLENSSCWLFFVFFVPFVVQCFFRQHSTIRRSQRQSGSTAPSFTRRAVPFRFTLRNRIA